MQAIEAILFEPLGCLSESPAEATGAAQVYEDVIPALAELRAMGIKLFITSSLSSAAVASFLKENALSEFFTGVWSGDNAGGIQGAIRNAIAAASLNPQHTMFLTDTEEGLKAAQSVRVQSVLMMNDPDEARRLSMLKPSGGIVSLHELPDFVRLVAAQRS